MGTIRLEISSFFQRIGELTHYPGQKWRADAESGHLAGPIAEITAKSTADADLWVYLAAEENGGEGTVGFGYIGTLCKPENQKKHKTTITERVKNVQETARWVTHEVGHNLGKTVLLIIIQFCNK